MASLQFSYVAIDSTGAKRTGVVDADSKDAAIAQLAASGRYVTEIAEQKSAANPVAAFSQGGRAPSREDLATFTRRLADLSGAGLPLDRVLQVVGEQTENQQLIAICSATLENVRGGMPVSEALSKYPQLVCHRVSLVRGQIRAVQFVDRFGDATRNPHAASARQ